VKLCFITDDTFYFKNPKDSTRQLLDLINLFSKVSEHKISMQKSVAFIYTCYKHAAKEIRKIIPFAITSKNEMLRNKCITGGKKLL
jgi:hypothetical protein